MAWLFGNLCVCPWFSSRYCWRWVDVRLFQSQPKYLKVFIISYKLHKKILLIIQIMERVFEVIRYTYFFLSIFLWGQCSNISDGIEEFELDEHCLRFRSSISLSRCDDERWGIIPLLFPFSLETLDSLRIPKSRSFRISMYGFSTLFP